MNYVKVPEGLHLSKLELDLEVHSQSFEFCFGGISQLPMEIFDES